MEVKNPGLFLILYLVDWYKFWATCKELNKLANCSFASLLDNLKLSINLSIISSSSTSLFTKSIIKLSIASNSL